MTTRQHPHPHMIRSAHLLGAHARIPQSPVSPPPSKPACGRSFAHDCRGPGTTHVPELRRPDLTSRETEVLLAWLRNDNKTQVGRSLFIAPCTVNTHLERIRAKYEEVDRPAPTKAALAARAIQDGIVCVYEL